MKTVRKVLKWILFLVAIPIAYFVGAYTLTAITVNDISANSTDNNVVFLNTNGVHLDIVIPKDDVDDKLMDGLILKDAEKYLSFGWGDENFYINTPSWSDLTFKNAFQAMLMKSTTLMHITRYKYKSSGWVAVIISESQLEKLNQYILNSFKIDTDGKKIILENTGYSTNDNFYRAIGSYSCLKTCNTWANSSFKDSGLKACYWTPFDFGLIDKYVE